MEANVARLKELARPRMGFLAAKDDEWWRETVRFFDADRQRIWVFWRRVLHTAHHCEQLTVHLRLMDRTAPSTYVPRYRPRVKTRGLRK